ncbi:MAG: hypothetical protein ACOX4I_00290 [Anaerovoracaceae bacterium]|jgi:hypothetical protein
MRMKKSMMKKVKLMTALIAAVLLVFSVNAPQAMAYFDRGDVALSVGRSAVTLDRGGSINVSVTASPAYDDQTQGCGMAECPQSCGEKNCLDDRGNCTCAGTEYTRYYTSFKVASSNNSVASAKYTGGAVKISALGAGSATISVTASLRQYTSMSKTIKVTVSKSDSSFSGGGSGGSSASGGTRDSAAAVDNGGTSSAATPQQKKAAAKKKAAASKKVIKSKKGTVISEDIIDYAQGSDIFRQIKGKDEYAIFNKKDEAGSIEYSWRFYGRDIKTTDDVDLNISLSDKAGEKVADTTHGKEAMYMTFAEQGSFPGKAEISARLTDNISNADKVYFYEYNAGRGRAVRSGKSLNVENGYAGRTMSHGGTYIMTAEEIPQSSVAPKIVIPVVCVIAAVIAVILIRRRSGGKPAA